MTSVSSKRLQCPECHVGFGTPELLELHLKSHSEYMPELSDDAEVKTEATEPEEDNSLHIIIGRQLLICDPYTIKGNLAKSVGHGISLPVSLLSAGSLSLHTSVHS